MQVSDLSERIANLSAVKLELLSRRLRGAQEPAKTKTIPRRSAATNPAPLSFAQQRLWFIEQLEPNSSAYNIPAALRLEGDLNLTALEESLNEIVRRHEALRTTFTMRDGQPVQLIHEALWLKLPVIDLQEVEEQKRAAEALRLAEVEAQKAFDLSNGPLLRVTLLKLSEREHIALVTMHHIISDGWSIGVMVSEMIALYDTLSNGQASQLKELPVQYADYSVWQRRWMTGDVLERQLAYWKRQLAGAPAVLELPLDRPRSEAQSFRGATRFFDLPSDLTESLQRLSRQESVTLFTLLLASFKALLHYYSGNEDIVVGTDVANRNLSETESLIGFFVNQLVLRTDVSGDPTFQELLKRVHAVTLGAYAHQDLPFEQLVETINPERSLKYSPLFQVKLVLQNVPMPPLELSGLTIKQVRLERATAQFDLILNMGQTEDGLTGLLEYNTDLFNPSTIERLLDHYEKLLRHVILSPQKRLKDLTEMLAEADKQRWHIASQSLEEAGRSKLRTVRRKAISSVS